MTKVMYDSVTASGIPTGGDIVCYYGDGPYANHTAVSQRFPHNQVIGIDVNGSMPSMQVRDWETGDKGGNLHDWVVAHNKASGHKDAVIYCNRSTIPEVRNLTGDQILGQDYYLWIATGDGTVYGPSQYPHVVACQTIWTQKYDKSIVWPTPGVAWTGGSVTKIPSTTPHIKVGNWELPQSPRNGLVMAVISWYGDDGLVTRQANIPEALWNQIKWSK